MPLPRLIPRRLVLALPALPALQGCAAPLPPPASAATTDDARALLAESAAAHGLPALAAMNDVNVSYAGQWHSLVGRLQPELVDAGFRGGSEERMLLPAGLVAQAHAGPAGRKQVLRRTAAGSPGEVRVWFNGVEARDEDRRDAAALVADGYSLFLLGPMLLAGRWGAERALVMERAGSETVTQDGRDWACDVLLVRMTPGLGLSGADRLALFIGREDRLMRRVRFTLDGLEGTRGAVAEVDTMDHFLRHGVWWPTRFHEGLLRPLPLAVHEWRLTGLDVDRGLGVGEVSGVGFEGGAVRAAVGVGWG